MPHLCTHLQEWRIVLAALTGAAVCLGLAGGWSQGSISPDHAPLEARPGRPAPGWFPALFETAPADAPARARARLEAAGLALDGPAFVQTIDAGHPALIDLFLIAGIDLNAPGAAGRTPLLAAADEGRWPLFAQLLAKGADPNLADDLGVTPLMVVAAGHRPAELAALLAKDARIDTESHEGRTAAAAAIAAHDFDAFTKLTPPAPSPTLLAAAWTLGDWRFIEPLLTRQSEPLPWDAPARRALTDAIAQRDEPKTRLLLAKYAGAPAPEDRAQPLLAWLLRDNQLESFKFLLQCGADPNTPLNSPVEKAFMAGLTQEPVRSYLVSEPGMTTLMLAAGLSQHAYVRALLDAGAKRGLLSGRAKLPALGFAADTNAPESLQMLLEGSPRPEQMRIEISLAKQCATVIREGKSVLSTPISTGRPGFATPSGDFVITDKHLEHKSTLYKAEMPFFMRLNCRDFGMHQGVLPGHPASHGCIRLPGAIAQKLFKEIPVGTLVTIR